MSGAAECLPGDVTATSLATCHHSLTRRMTRRMLTRGCHAVTPTDPASAYPGMSGPGGGLPGDVTATSLATCHHSLTRRTLTRRCHAVTPTDPASAYPGMSGPLTTHSPGECLPGDVTARASVTTHSPGECFPGDVTARASVTTHSPGECFPGDVTARASVTTHSPGECFPGDVTARASVTTHSPGECFPGDACHHSLTRRMLPRGCHGESLCHHSLTRRMLPRGCHGESLCHHSLTRRMLPRGCHGESLCHHSLTRRMLPRGCHGESLCHHSLTRRMLPRGCHGESLCHHSLTRRMLTRGCHAITPTDPASVYPGMSRPLPWREPLSPLTYPGRSRCHATPMLLQSIPHLSSIHPPIFCNPPIHSSTLSIHSSTHPTLSSLVRLSLPLSVLAILSPASLPPPRPSRALVPQSSHLCWHLLVFFCCTQILKNGLSIYAHAFEHVKLATINFSLDMLRFFICNTHLRFFYSSHTHRPVFHMLGNCKNSAVIFFSICAVYPYKFAKIPKQYGCGATSARRHAVEQGKTLMTLHLELGRSLDAINDIPDEWSSILQGS